MKKHTFTISELIADAMSSLPSEAPNLQGDLEQFALNLYRAGIQRGREEADVVAQACGHEHDYHLRTAGYMVGKKIRAIPAPVVSLDDEVTP